MATKLTYKEQLLHPNWQRKRLETLEAYGFECTNCGATEKTLHVHHRRYVKGRKAWEYETDELNVLCEDCHQSEHDARDELERLVAAIGPSGLDVLLGLGAGYMLASMDLDRALAEELAIGRDLYFEVGLAATTLDHGGEMKWRQVLIDHVARYPANPVTAYYAEAWRKEESKD